ncbi:efflux RND transporter periplasmic adaptor subunit [Altericroceibacterium spongiae]|uniref:Efflux RND transporter periplasmic adaptor subunit n=1 Tax=Altericroceibacterium spongiae TaxID=2320269 RepID=A0A420ERL1_9SPHN|nr:efflux RND transporter periplasmic adaptor subunit [Altericroceibacterium spongiae]RKF23322.1 efflux RND transporter periplasmic adaptor subunit [Altericroceibacterium spongiae]
MKFRPLLAAVLCALAGCSGNSESEAPQALPVETVTIKEEQIPNIVELPGRTEAVRIAEVRARVTGIVQRRLYEEGVDVGAGQPLFRIDPSELRASYAQSEASLARARATATNAQAVVDRYKPLVGENAISQQEYDAAVAAAREAKANVAQIKAELQAASLQLGYTTVEAPISGRAGRAQVTEGALVSQPEGTLMTRIEQLDPIYVTFSQAADDMLAIRRAITEGKVVLNDNDKVEVSLKFSDGTDYPIKGVIDFLDYSVDENTGTVAMRATFPNPDKLLLPGEFVRARLIAGQRKAGILVPQKAVVISATNASVFVVSKDSTVQVRQVEVGTMVDKSWVIEKGLEPGDQVIVNNIQKLQPDMPVKPVQQGKGKAADAQGDREAAAKSGEKQSSRSKTASEKQ